MAREQQQPGVTGKPMILRCSRPLGGVLVKPEHWGFDTNGRIAFGVDVELTGHVYRPPEGAAVLHSLPA